MSASAHRCILASLAAALLLGGCASSPPPENPPAQAAAAPPAAEQKPSPPGQTRYKWSNATEAEVAAVLDAKFREAAKQFVQLKRNDQVMFCKRYRDIGTMIAQIHCITEAELRKQVEDGEQVRQQMKNRMGKCDITSGCQAGG